MATSMLQHNLLRKHPRRRWASTPASRGRPTAVGVGTCAALRGPRMLWARERRAPRARRASESFLPATRAGDVTRRDPRQETRPPQPEVGDPPVTAVTVTRLGPDDPSAAPAPGRRSTRAGGWGKIEEKVGGDAMIVESAKCVRQARASGDRSAKFGRNASDGPRVAATRAERRRSQWPAPLKASFVCSRPPLDPEPHF